MSRLKAQLDGPGGAYITSSRWSKSEEMSISFRVDQPEIDINKPVCRDARHELQRRTYDLRHASNWLARMAADPILLKRELARVEREHPSLSPRIGDSIRELYDEHLMREINTSLTRRMAQPVEIPIAFSREKLIETINNARRIAREASMEPINRFMLAVNHADRVGEIFNLRDDEDDDAVYPADEVRAPVSTLSGGTYGLMMGLRVVVDPEMEDKWELRDSQTGDKVRFVENPEQPGVRYYFDGSKMGQVLPWPREV
jgi:hypothetical protein